MSTPVSLVTVSTPVLLDTMSTPVSLVTVSTPVLLVTMSTPALHCHSVHTSLTAANLVANLQPRKREADAISFHCHSNNLESVFIVYTTAGVEVGWGVGGVGGEKEPITLK